VCEAPNEDRFRHCDVCEPLTEAGKTVRHVCEERILFKILARRLWAQVAERWFRYPHDP